MADDRRLERIEVKIDETCDHMDKMQITLAEQHGTLKEHIRRTKLLEDKIEPIQRHVNMVQGGLALLGILATIGAAIEGIRILMGK